MSLNKSNQYYQFLKQQKELKKLLKELEDKRNNILNSSLDIETKLKQYEEVTKLHNEKYEDLIKVTTQLDKLKSWR